MKKRALKKENERLRGELLEASRKICDLRFVNKRYEDELADSKEKYAELLEKYITMMGKAAKLNELSLAPESEIVERIFCDIEGMLLKWYHENAYDAQLDTGVREIKKKYMGGLGK